MWGVIPYITFGEMIIENRFYNFCVADSTGDLLLIYIVIKKEVFICFVRVELK
jgi:hypothetical protein